MPCTVQVIIQGDYRARYKSRLRHTRAPGRAITYNSLLRGYYTTGLDTTVWIGPKVSFKVQRNFILVRLKGNLRWTYIFTSILRNNIAPFTTYVLNKTSHKND